MVAGEACQEVGRRARSGRCHSKRGGRGPEEGACPVSAERIKKIRTEKFMDGFGLKIKKVNMKV